MYSSVFSITIFIYPSRHTSLPVYRELLLSFTRTSLPRALFKKSPGFLDSEVLIKLFFSAEMPLKKRSRQENGNSQISSSCNEEYFDSYGNLSVHALMLKDAPRVESYARALAASKERIEGQIVIDVGSGTGILSMLCYKLCNPKHIYAVEANPYIANLSRMLIEQNCMSDKITVINKPVESVTFEDWEHGDQKASVVVSEWMGFYLVHEAMLDSVLYARDFLCSPNPLLLPSHCRIMAACVSNERFRFENMDLFQSPVICGIDLSAVALAINAELPGTPQTEVLAPDQVLSEPVVAFDFDLGKLDRLAFANTPLVTQLKMVTNKSGEFSSIGIWFDVSFEGTDIVLNTSPFHEATHWKQTNVFLGCWAPVPAGAEIEIKLTITRPDPTDRQYTITIET